MFSYLVDPEKFVLWMGVEARIDPTPGGKFWLDVDGEHIAAGRYSLIEPPHRLVLTWGWEGSQDVPPESTTVEITLTELPQGTLLRLSHRGLPSEAEQESHREGWLQYATKLQALLASSSGSQPFTRV